jgi:hypothetical protein
VPEWANPAGYEGREQSSSVASLNVTPSDVYWLFTVTGGALRSS